MRPYQEKARKDEIEEEEEEDGGSELDHSKDEQPY